MRTFDWRDGERTIHFGRGRAAEAVDLLGGPGYTLLTTERARAGLPDLVEAAGTVLDVRSGRVDEIAGELLKEADGDRFVALGGGRVIDVAKALAAARGGAQPRRPDHAVGGRDDLGAPACERRPGRAPRAAARRWSSATRRLPPPSPTTRSPEAR